MCFLPPFPHYKVEFRSRFGFLRFGGKNFASQFTALSCQHCNGGRGGGCFPRGNGGMNWIRGEIVELPFTCEIDSLTRLRFLISMFFTRIEGQA